MKSLTLKVTGTLIAVSKKFKVISAISDWTTQENAMKWNSLTLHLTRTKQFKIRGCSNQPMT